MKRLASIILALCIVLGCCACGDTADTKPEGLQVGYARASIMPEDSVQMAGSATAHYSTGYLDILYATCIAITEGDNTILVFTQDLLYCRDKLLASAREAITQATGVLAENIYISSTHSHNVPYTESGANGMDAWRELYLEALVKAAQDALSDRASATLYGGKTQTEGMNFVRHYKMSDGTYAGDNFGTFSNLQIEGHATQNDPGMVLVKIDREEKKDIMLMNWQAHPCITKLDNSTSTMLSADFVGAARDAFEKETGMLFAYFTGAAGNQNTFSKISEENNFLGLKEFGAKLAQYAIDAMENMSALESTGIKTTQVQLELDYNHADEDKLQQAKEVVRLNTSAGYEAANELAIQYGFSSVHHASSVTVRPSLPATGTIELNAVYVGGMAFITAPYEMFSDSGLYIKEKSPFDITMLMTCANGSGGYFPTEEAYNYGSYEGNGATFARGCAEAAAEKFVEMLETLQ